MARRALLKTSLSAVPHRRIALWAEVCAVLNEDIRTGLALVVAEGREEIKELGAFFRLGEFARRLFIF